MKSAMTEMAVNARGRMDAKACCAANALGSAHALLLGARTLCNNGPRFRRTLRAADGLQARVPDEKSSASATRPNSPTTSLNAALGDATKVSRWEKVAYAALATGALVAVANSVLHTGRLLAQWPAVVKLVEGVIS